MSRQTQPQFAFSAGEVSPLLYARPDYQRTQQGLRSANGFLPLRQGGITRAPGTTYRGQAAGAGGGPVKLISFEFSAGDAVVLEFTPNLMRVWRYGVLVDEPGSPGTPYQLVTQFDAASLARLQWAQSADVIYFADGARPIQKLSRLALDNWTIEDFLPQDGPFLPSQDISVSSNSQVSNTTLTGPANTFSPDMVGGLIRVEIDGFEDTPAWTPNEAVPQFLTRHYDGKVYFLRQTGADVGSVPPTHSDGKEQVADGVIWEYLYDKVGIAIITQFNSSSSVDALIVRRFPLEVETQGAARISLGAWSDYAGWPRAIEIYDQRLVAAGTALAPRMICFSQLGIFDEWFAGTLDTDGFSYTISGSVSLNEIEWLATGLHGLYVGTTGEILATQGVDESRVVTPSNFTIRPMASVPASSIPPIMPTGFPIFVTKDRQRVFELRYAINEQGHQPRELSLPADHIAAVGFTDMAWQSTAHPLIWFARADGTLAALLYDVDQDILGWVPMSVALGFVASLCVTPDPITGQDIVTLAVSRFVNGQFQMFIEEMALPYGTLQASVAPQKSHHLFAASQFSPVSATDTFSVPHLKGEDVWAWTEAGAFGPFTVPAGGAITLPQAVTNAIVGLHDPNHIAELMSLHPASSSGDTTGDDRRILPGSAVVLHRTADGFVSFLERQFDEQGWFASDPEPLVRRPIADPAIDVVSGAARLVGQSGMAAEVSMRFMPAPGAPMTILAVTPAMQQESG